MADFSLFDEPQAPAKTAKEPASPAAKAEAAPPADFALFDEPQHAAPAESPSFLSQVAQPFKDIYHTARAANSAIGNAIVHPVDTFNAIRANPLPNAREALRGVNDNIPFANRAVEALGGPPAQSPEDEELALPGARAVGNFAGAPVTGEMLGRIAGKVVEKAAPVVRNAIKGIGEGAEARQIARTKEALELKANKGTRAGLKSDVVDTAIAESPELRKAAGNDAKVAEVTGGIKSRAAAKLKPLYEAAGPADEAAAKAVANVDARIADLRTGDVNASAAAKKLQALRDEFNDRLGERQAVSASDLRAEQSAYQKNGYAKNIAADPDVAASILAHREMSKAVGDAVVEHVTGVPYAAAKKLAAEDPNSIAAKLFKANDQISAANKIEAGIADRAGKAQPAHGPMAVAKRVAHHAVAPLFVGASHGPMAGLATAVGQEALHAAPAVARAAASAVDNRLAGLANLTPPARAAYDAIISAQGQKVGSKVVAAIKAGVPRAIALQAAAQHAQ
jgi:hypothetical protein